MESIENAKITSVSISMADHGCVTFWVFVKLNGGGCGIGGYCIGHGYVGADDDFFDGAGLGIEAMARIMDTVGVDKWEDLKDKYIRVVNEGWGKSINKIGNIIKDKWFDIDKFFKEKQKT